MPTREEIIDILWSKDQIRDLAMLYCRAADRGDVSLFEELYHPGALDEHGSNTSHTAREFIDSIPAMRPRMDELQHNVTNHIITVDGDNAHGEVYVLAYHRFMEQGQPALLVMGGRYLDRYERREETWRIAHRKCVEDWSVLVPAPETPETDLLGAGLPRGAAGSQDPSYAFFKLAARVGSSIPAT